MDSGRNYSPGLIRQYSKKPSESDDWLRRIHVAEVLDLSDLMSVSDKIHEIDCIDLVVVDNLAGILNLSGQPGGIKRQRELFSALESMRTTVNESGIHLALTGHTRHDWRTGEARPIGGNVLGHDVDSVVRVDWINSTTDIVRFSIERSPSSSSGTSIILKLERSGLKSIRSL
ncbi:MAG: hypothetical protein JSW61_00435 [Candidatus Thorarchaeota archaeon]|nr:MAG: hypothetical protein JSW61_00435 [Candidatus Thorarchaeota archaeon]